MPLSHDHLALSSAGQRAWRIVLGGQVQGVGFRPFVYRLAQQHAITGWVQNRIGTVAIHAQGSQSELTLFLEALLKRSPTLSRPRLLERQDSDITCANDFRILHSEARSEGNITVPTDSFLCPACHTELIRPDDRRYQYPFINCTQCGPRYTIIESLPYDRANTTMAAFLLCPDCQTEYQTPLDRRFHAEPIACPRCGPQLTLCGDDTDTVSEDPSTVIDRAVTALRHGAILAAKSVGGYHLLCDARNGMAIQTLRERKQRPDKPLAVMFPATGADGLTAIRAHVQLTSDEAECLTNAARPILLARKRIDTDLPDNIAPRLPDLGVMLPCSPLHQLLVNAFGSPLIATSGNISGEPVLTNEQAVTTRLGHVADAFLHHDRPIARPVDDSVFKRIAGKVRPLRVGRGSAPLELSLPVTLSEPVLAVGAHLKNTVALGWDDRVVMSPHIGDMDSRRSRAVFTQVVDDLQNLYSVRARTLLCDAHPAYATTRWAQQTGLPWVSVLHHHAHASALAFEAGVDQTGLIVTWDGLGLGADQTLWGGDVLSGHPGLWTRLARFKPFRLPGGDRVGHEPWRSAAALCWQTGHKWPALAELDPTDLAHHAWRRRLHCHETTSVGRLFDAAAAMILDIHHYSYDAQGPMLLEGLVRTQAQAIPLPLHQTPGGLWEIDWSPLVPMLLNTDISRPERAAMFHASLARVIVETVTCLHAHVPFTYVGLTGGVFQNRYLTEWAREALTQAGFEVVLTATVPCNDAGISVGQVLEFAAGQRASTERQMDDTLTYSAPHTVRPC